MLKKILIGFAALILIFLVVVMAQPATYHVDRAVMINAPAEVVWAETSDFNQWSGWSPWAKSDPTQKETVAGEPGTVGHTMSWEGEKTGKGTMTLREVDKPTRVAIDILFYTPVESRADTAFEIIAKEDTVEVTWSVDGENGFVGKFFDLLMGIEDMIGESYDQGLADLKAVSEEKAKKQAEAMAAAAPAAEPATDEPAAAAK